MGSTSTKINCMSLNDLKCIDKQYSIQFSLQILKRIDEIQEHTSATSPGQHASSGSEVNPLLTPTDVIRELDTRFQQLETQVSNPHNFI